MAGSISTEVNFRRTSLESRVATYPSAHRTSTKVICQEQSGEWLVANPNPDTGIEYCSTVRTLAWLTALHPLTVNNVSPETFFSIALGCRRWTRENEAGRTKYDIVHHSLLAKCVQPWAGEAQGLQKQPSHNLAGVNRGVPRLLWLSWGECWAQGVLCVAIQQSPSSLFLFLLVQQCLIYWRG